MRREACLIALLLALCAAGCAVSPTRDLTSFAQQSASNSFEIFDARMENTALVLPVVHDQQTDGASCGAHVLASVINYWRGSDTISGNAIYQATPPAIASGYSMAEIMSLARGNGLLASGVRLDDDAIIRELEAGRPVLTPVRLPSIYVQRRTFPGADAPVLGFAGDVLTYRVGRVSELTGVEMVDHYLLIVGYDSERFVVVEPVMGYRTISHSKLARYRQAFNEAAIVFSASRPPSSAAAPAEAAAPG